MKFNKWIFTILAVASLCCTVARAQFDLFGAPRSLVLAAPGTSVAALATNGPIDIHGYVGIAVVDITSSTNPPGGSCTAQLFTSNDQTNYTAVTYASAVSSSVIVTNLMYGSTNMLATNTMFAPGTVTTPTAGTAGWATTYLAPAAMTNTAAVTITSKAYYELGFNADDAGRYLYIVWTPTTSTNAVSAMFKGRWAQ